ncbi:MAG: thermonuclease family protein [Planctomycetes bacterium]|nr:thermonuclease family protein [Planctomycetota bacterium]
MNSNKKILVVLVSAVLTALLIFCSLRVVSLSQRLEVLENIIKAEQVSSLSETPILHEEKTAPPDDSKHEVLSVIDGDTITIGTTAGSLKVRVIGIDTPETVHPFKPVEVGGQAASDKARELLEGQTVVIHYDPDPEHGKWGKYKRLLAYIDLPDGRDFGLVMIQEGFARAYPKYPFSRQESYLKAEEIAKHNKTNIWAEHPE